MRYRPSGCGCGCLSFVVGMIALFIFVSLPSMITDNGLINGVMGQIFCGDSSAYINESYTAPYRRNGGITWNLTAKCQTSANGVEDVTERQKFVGIGLGVLGIVISVGIVIFLPASALNPSSKKVQGASEEAKDSPPSP